MTALKKTVRTRRGVEPAGRPARREVERGRGARTNSSRTFAHCRYPRSRYARKHLRGRLPPRDSGGVNANLRVFSHLLIAGLDDTKFSGELHWYRPARTYPSDSEARPVGSDERCREGYRAHLGSRRGVRFHPRMHGRSQRQRANESGRRTRARRGAGRRPPL